MKIKQLMLRLQMHGYALASVAAKTRPRTRLLLTMLCAPNLVQKLSLLLLPSTHSCSAQVRLLSTMRITRSSMQTHADIASHRYVLTGTLYPHGAYAKAAWADQTVRGTTSKHMTPVMVAVATLYFMLKAYSCILLSVFTFV